MKIFLGLVLIGGVVLFGILTVRSLAASYLNLRQMEIKNEAKFQCAQSSRYQETTSAKVTVWYPIDELYKNCLKEKGL